MHIANVVPFGIANPCLAKPAAKGLHRAMKRIMARAEERSLSYAPTEGELGLRRQIAYRYLDTVGSNIEPDNICITNGGQEALLIALQAVATKGDIIAVESPTYHGLLELIDSLGMLAIEVETCPEDGVMLEPLRPELQCNADRMSALVAQYFPAETRTSKPVGGPVLWLELPHRVDAEKLFDLAIEAGISTAPGRIFSPCDRYRNFVRLSFGHPWTDEIEKSLQWLGEKVSALAKG